MPELNMTIADEIQAKKIKFTEACQEKIIQTINQLANSFDQRIPLLTVEDIGSTWWIKIG